MRTAQVNRPRYVGVAPGTTTIVMPKAINGLAADYPPPDGGPGVPPYPTQPWVIPTPAYSDDVRIAMPPNKIWPGPIQMRLTVPNAQKTMGPMPNDRDAARAQNYQPVKKGWIRTDAGDIFTLQGGGNVVTFQSGGLRAEGTDWHKWAVIASIVGTVAVVATSSIAILEYRRRRR